MALQHRFVAGMVHGEWYLAKRVDSQDLGRRNLPPEHVWLALKSGVLGALHAVIARALRSSGYALMASPLLVPAYLVLRLLSPELGGWLVALFVVTVVAFFATLNVFILLSAIRYAVASHTTLRLWGAPSEAGAAARAQLFGDTQPKTVVGEVIRIGAPADGQVVVREVVSRAKSVRVLEACDFALYTDGGDYVVIRIEDPPLLLAAREPRQNLALPEATRASLAERGLTNPERERSLHSYTVRVGDRVTITGFEHEPIARVDRFELGGEVRGIKTSDVSSAPYRGARSDGATQLRCREGSPMLIACETRS